MASSTVRQVAGVLSFALLSILLSVSVSGSVPAKVSESTYPLKVSDTLPGNLLPSYKFMLVQVEGGSTAVPLGGGDVPPSPFVPDDSCPDEIWDHASKDLHAPQLPHLTQDQWTCERKQTTVPSIALENEHIRASVIPSGVRAYGLCMIRNATETGRLLTQLINLRTLVCSKRGRRVA